MVMVAIRNAKLELRISLLPANRPPCATILPNSLCSINRKVDRRPRYGPGDSMSENDLCYKMRARTIPARQSNLMSIITTVNLKADLPTVEEARRRLSEAMAIGRKQHAAVVKIIHGYGSSGTGGAIRDGIRKSLRKRRKKGEIRGYIFGEHWSVFDAGTQALLAEHPSLRRDPDLDRGNEGMSILIL
jgi:hypothetical protein